jgi:hypothetical protein
MQASELVSSIYRWSDISNININIKITAFATETELNHTTTHYIIIYFNVEEPDMDFESVGGIMINAIKTFVAFYK